MTFQNSYNIKSKEISREILLSSIEFFKISIQFARSKPKISIANFAIALDLALKSMIALQHWGLLVEKFDKNTLKNIVDGSISTVKANELIDIFNAIYSDKIGSEESTSYKDVFKLRNRIVHFYHNEVSEFSTSNQSIVTELYAWNFLSGRLKRWNAEHFKSFEINISNLTKTMVRLEEFAVLIFNKVKNEILDKKSSGKNIFKCYRCKQLARIEGETREQNKIFQIVSTMCSVCHSGGSRLVTQCPSCKSRLPMVKYDYTSFKCADCEVDYFKHVKPVNKYIKDENRVFCPECSSGFVVLDNGLFVCLECEAYGGNTEQCLSCGTSYFGEGMFFLTGEDACFKCNN